MSPRRDTDLSRESAKELSVKRRRQAAIFLFLASLICGFLYFVWRFSQNPAVGVIRVGALPVQDENFGQGKELKRFAGKYVSFSYPGAYAEKAHAIPVNGPVKESIFLSAADFEGRKIAIVVEEREGGDFEASPSFQMRSDRPEEYDQEPVSVSGQSGFLFKKDTQVFERTFFLHSEDFVISISTTSPISVESLEQELFAVIGSLRFRE